MFRMMMACALALATMVGCSGSGADTANDSSNLTEDQPRTGDPSGTAVEVPEGVVGTTFVTGSCGHSLKLEAGDQPHVGPFVYSRRSCDDPNDFETFTGIYVVVGLSVTLTPENGEAIEYEIELADGETTQVMDVPLPKGTPVLRGDGPHGEFLFPDGFTEGCGRRGILKQQSSGSSTESAAMLDESTRRIRRGRRARRSRGSKSATNLCDG